MTDRPLAVKIYQFQGHRDSIYCLESLGDGKTFCSAGAEGLVVLWSLDQPDQGHVLARVSGSIYAMVYCSETGILYIGQNNEGIQAIDVKNKLLIKSISLGKVSLFSLTMNGNQIYAGTEDGELIILNRDELKVISRTKLSSKSLRTIAVHPDNGQLALGFSDHCIRILDLQKMKAIQEWSAHQGSVFTLAFEPNGKYLISGSRDARLMRWTVSNGYEASGSAAAHLFTINHIAFSPDGEHFLTCSMDKTIKIWSSNDLTLLRVLDRARHAGHGNSVNRLLWLTTDEFVSAGDDRIVSVWKFHKIPPH